ncbi:Transcriptional activator spt7, partial [Coemansia spiralis]
MAGDETSCRFSDDWDARSYLIAQRLQERGEWPSYLTAKELPWVARALESPELWRQFISPRPEQWRLRALPSAAFESVASGAQVADGPVPAITATAAPPPPPPPLSEPLRGGTQVGPTGKRVAPDNDGEDDGSGGEKRARTAAFAFESDDDALSVLSGSDIDMGMWLGGSAAASHTVSPEPAEGGATRATQAAAVEAAAASTTTTEPPLNADVEVAERSLVCAAAAFHARTAIFEHYAAALCDTGECSVCTDVASAWADVRHAESTLRGPAPAKAGGAGSDGLAQVPSMPDRPPQTSLLARRVDEDEDYDDGDGDGESDAGASKATAEPKAQETDKAAATNGVAAATERAARSIVVREVFHTLDELEDVAHEHKEHAAHVEQIREIAGQRSAAPKDILANKIGALQNMKNLAQFIDKHRDSVSMSTRELSNLLSEVRPKRSKWANERRVGQVELYEALEQVLQELRSMGEAALP